MGLKGLRGGGLKGLAKGGLEGGVGRVKGGLKGELKRRPHRPFLSCF